MYTLHNLKQTWLSQVSSRDKKESECCTPVENTFFLCALISLFHAPLLPSNYHFFSLVKPLGDSCQAPVPLPQSGAGTAILQGTFLWAHLLSEQRKQHTHTPALHPLWFFCWVLPYSFKTGKSAFFAAPQHVQLF